MLQPLKSLYRFCFKWPARKYLGMFTLWIDVRAIIKRAFQTASSNDLKPVSVCVGLMNRSKAFKAQLLASLVLLADPSKIELSVVDCNSSDEPDLLGYLKVHWKGQLTYTKTDLPFTRSKIFNLAVQQSHHDLVFVCDADIALPPQFLAQMNAYCRPYQAWFPEVMLLDEAGLPNRYCSEGVGMLGCHRHQFEATKGFDERIVEWGKEDWLLYFEFYKIGIAPFRTQEPLMQHAFHQSLKPKGFKPLF
jgi:predicted glycosyltransferase involved in capsule biosynthesis